MGAVSFEDILKRKNKPSEEPCKFLLPLCEGSKKRVKNVGCKSGYRA